MDESYLDDIYCKIYSNHLKEIGSKIYINEKLIEKSIDKVEYNKFIGGSIKEILLSGDTIEENVKGQFIFDKRSQANIYKSIYNKTDGRGVWHIIQSDTKYKIVKKTNKIVKPLLEDQMIFSACTNAYIYSRKYNKRDGKGVWGVIEWEDTYYKIVKSAGNTDPTFNKTRSLIKRN